MTQQIIDTGLVANDGTGESLRNAFTAVNNNFANIWAAGPVDTQVVIYSNVVSTNVTNLDLRLAGNGIGTITVESTVVPSIDRVYDLGSPSKKYDSVYAQYYFGNGAFLTGISGGNGSASNSFSTISANGVNIVATNSTSTLTFVPGNNISILGNSSTDAVTISLDNNPVFAGDLSTVGNIIGANVNTGNISLSGNVVSALRVSGNVTAPYFIGNGSQLTGITTSLSGNLAGNIDTLEYSINSSNGEVRFGNTISVVGNAIITNSLLVGDQIATSGNVSANYFIGDGSQLTNLPTGNYSNANVAAYLPVYNGNILAANVSANYYLGNGRFLTGIPTVLSGNLAGNIDTLEYSINSSNGEVRFGNTISVIGNIIATDNLLVGDQIATTGNITSAANVHAQNFIGNVYGNVFANILVPGANTDVLFNTNGEADATSGLTFNKTANLLTVGGNVVAEYFIGNGRQLTGLDVPISEYLPTYTGNLVSLEGNVITTANVTADSFFGNTASLTGNIVSSANVIASYFVGNFAGNISGNLTVPGANTQVIFNTDGSADATSGFTFDKTTNAVSIGGNVSAVGNVAANYFIGNGSQLTGIDATSIQNGNSNVKVYANANVTTTVAGVANVLVMANTGAYVTGLISATGNVISANVSTTGLITATGNVTAGNIDTAGLVSTNNFAITGEITGNLIPAANITYDIGDPDNRWKDLYLSGNSIYIDSQIISANGNGLTLSNTAFTTALEVSGNATVGNLNTAGLVSATGNATAGNINTAGVVTATGNITGDNLNASGLSLSGNVLSAINSTSNITTTANIATGGILTDNYYYANGTPVDFEQPAGANTQIQFNDNNDFGATAAFTFDSVANALYVGGTASVTGNVEAGNVTTAGAVAADTVTSYSSNANLSLVPNGTGIVTIDDSNGGSTGIQLGTPTAGALVSNAVTLTTSTSVTNGIAQLNLILGKLVPPSPPNFPGGNTLSITTATSSGRMTGGFTQTDNTPGANKAVTAGNVVSVVRGSSYTTNTISNTGPGDSGVLTAYLNGTGVGNVTFNTGASPSANGTYGGNLVVTNNYDYHTANSSITAGFWYVFSAAASGTVTQGWNEIYLGDSVAGNTNTPSWYYDASAPGTPTYSNVTVTACATPSLSYSSTIPHYNSGTQFGFGFSVNKLSGDLYPNNGNLLTNSTAAGGAFQTPASVSYAAANVTVPLTRNLYVSSGAATANTTANIVSTGFGSSATGPSVTVTNSYNSASQAFTTALANTVLYKNGNSTAVDEGNVVVGSTIGTGSGNAFRIVNPGTGNTPAYTGSEAAFDGQTSTLQTYDATVVGSGAAGVLKHDQTNYSTGYLPAGPNLSSGRGGTQYFTFKFVRTAVSKFDIRYTGTIAGMWVALPGSVIDSSSSANGWIDMSVAYAGAGYPGVNAPGNGSDGCALGGTVTLNSAVTNSSKTCTFGTVSSSSTATNEIYVRIALTSGQSVTALTLQTASN